MYVPIVNVYGCDSNSDNPEGAPSSFCIARITARGLCIVIKVALLGGTAGHIRHKVRELLTILIHWNCTSSYSRDTIKSFTRQFLPCGHSAILDTLLLRTGAKSPAKTSKAPAFEIYS